MKTRVTIQRCDNGVKVSNDKGCSWFFQTEGPDLSMRIGIAHIAAAMLCSTITTQLDNVDTLEFDLEILGLTKSEQSDE